VAITPAKGNSQAFSQIGKFMEGRTEGARRNRLKPEGKVNVQKQQVRSAKPTRKQQMKKAQKSSDQRRGGKVDVRA